LCIRQPTGFCRQLLLQVGVTDMAITPSTIVQAIAAHDALIDQLQGIAGGGN
jgi:hypothetical protein